jgi:hypothetical protein
MGTILAISDGGYVRIWLCIGGGLSGIYRSYPKAMECVYADRGKEVLQLAGQPVWLQKWQHWCGFRAKKTG